MPEADPSLACSGCTHENGPWCTANPRGYALAVEERKYGWLWSLIFGHCGKWGWDFVAKAAR